MPKLQPAMRESTRRHQEGRTAGHWFSEKYGTRRCITSNAPLIHMKGDLPCRLVALYSQSRRNQPARNTRKKNAPFLSGFVTATCFPASRRSQETKAVRNEQRPQTQDPPTRGHWQTPPT